MDFSPYLANKIARWLNGNAMPTAPTNLYVGLWDGDPLDTGAEIGALITGAAARIVINQDTVADDGDDHVLTSDADTDFGVSVSATPRNITHATIHDAVAAGNVLFVKELDTPRTVHLNDHVFINSADLSIQIDMFE